MEHNVYKRPLVGQEIADGLHREFVGGMWDEVGKLQFNFLVKQGLQPYMKILDVGCGCLRGGVYFINYLNAGNYYGIDINESLINAGYEKELDIIGLKEKMPRSNLLVNASFQAYLFGVYFDFALAQSVFTHLPFNHIRRCLIELAKCMKLGGKFYATFFECPPNQPIETEITHQPGSRTTYLDQDPYHYWLRDFSYCIKKLPWEIDYFGEWQHPRAQKILCFTRI
jgi:hypothetical protein